MTNEQILKKVIEKAHNNGWDLWGWKKFQVVMGGVGFYDGTGDFLVNKGNLEQDNTVIFNHDFAKAFWGEEKICLDCHELINSEDKKGNEYCLENHSGSQESWQYHLQQMVISENPIEYLEQFICQK